MIRSSRALRIAGLLTVVALAAVVIWYLRLPALVAYTSQPFDAGRHRIQVLVPRGWKLSAGGLHLPTGILGQYELAFLVFESRPSILPRWLRELLHQPEDHRADLFIEIARAPQLIGDQMDPFTGGIVASTEEIQFNGPYLAYRRIKARTGDVFGLVMVSCEDRSRLDTLDAAICKSFRIK